MHIVTVGGRWRYRLYGLITFAALNYLALFISGWLHCDPVQKLWNTSVPGKCWSEVAQSGVNIWYGGKKCFHGKQNLSLTALWRTVFSIVYDFVLAILPVIFLWNVQISLRRKIGICMLMGLGTV